MDIFTKSAKETQKFGQEFGNRLKGGEILALVGDLGSGKTTFVQGLAKGLGIKGRITSPTFILMREYSVHSAQDTGIRSLYHLDLYRFEGNVERELKNLGVEDLWGKRENIVVIEWADKTWDLIPPSAIWITFEGNGEGQRRLEIRG